MKTKDLIIAVAIGYSIAKVEQITGISVVSMLAAANEKKTKKKPKKKARA